MFCNNFKKYRKLSGMTQEEVAKFLMVTPQAVSKWETGNGTPDISLLVPIAELFGVSTDVLLERSDLVPDTMLNEIYYSKESYKNKYSEYVKLLKTSPNNEQILLKLLSISAELLSHEKDNLSVEEKNDLISSSEGYAKNLQKEKQLDLWAESQGKLADVYIASGDYRRAKEVVARLPKCRYTKKRMLGNLALKEDQYEQSRNFYKESVDETVEFLLWDIERIAQSFSYTLKNDFKNSRAKMNEIYQIEYDLIHAIGFHGSPLLQNYLCNASIRLAQREVWHGDYEKAFVYLDKFMSVARMLHNQTTADDIRLSPILPKKEYCQKTITKSSILFRLSWNAFNPIRKDSRFISYVQEVEHWS